LDYFWATAFLTCMIFWRWLPRPSSNKNQKTEFKSLLFKYTLHFNPLIVTCTITLSLIKSFLIYNNLMSHWLNGIFVLIISGEVESICQNLVSGKHNTRSPHIFFGSTLQWINGYCTRLVYFICFLIYFALHFPFS
jgi:hypothetical protein